MPTFHVSNVRKIDRSKKGLKNLYIGHSDGADYFLTASTPEHLQILDMAVDAKTNVTIASTSFQKPSAGSMFIASIDAE